MFFLAYLVNLVFILSAGTLVWALPQRLADGGGIVRLDKCGAPAAAANQQPPSASPAASPPPALSPTPASPASSPASAAVPTLKGAALTS